MSRGSIVNYAQRRQHKAARDERVVAMRAQAEQERCEREAKSDALTNEIRRHYNETMHATGGEVIP